MQIEIHTLESTFLRSWCRFNRICDYLKMDMLKQNSHVLTNNAGNRSEKWIYKAIQDVAKLQNYAKCMKNESDLWIFKDQYTQAK